MELFAAFYTQIKIWTLQRSLLVHARMCEVPLISKACKFYANVFFSLLAAQVVEEEFHKYPKVRLTKYDRIKPEKYLFFCSSLEL